MHTDIVPIQYNSRCVFVVTNWKYDGRIDCLHAIELIIMVGDIDPRTHVVFEI
jgi:hypothetical protein